MSIDTKLIRIGVFYDGNYLSHVSNYYNYVHPRRNRISISGLHEFVRAQVAKLEDTEEKFCQVVDSHYFRGRFPAYEAQNRNKLLSERIFDDILMREGVVTHYLPLSTRGEKGEKGIDVWLALEALELTFYKKFNVVVLIACDGDYLPLIRKLNGMGTRVMVLAWDFNYTDEFGNSRTTVTSIDLINEATYPLLMHDLIDSKTNRNDPSINGLFVSKEAQFKYDSSYSRFEYPTREQPVMPDDATLAEEHQQGIFRVQSIKQGYGFVTTDDPKKNLFFYWEDVVGDFNELQEGDRVTYTVGYNERGECAREVQKV